MTSNDFASTYVGTPFYMSPEICAAERYSAASDIWSLGCIIYELCTKRPPFNARSQFELIQKIRLGKYDSIPQQYSPELQTVIARCLKVNSSQRPDAAELLNLPVVRLMRKQREVADFGKTLIGKEEKLARLMREAEAMKANFEREKERMHQEIEDTVRREWEVKARLEIDRQVNLEIEKLRKTYEEEVSERVASEVEKRLRSQPVFPLESQESQLDDSASTVPSTAPSTTKSLDHAVQSSISFHDDDDFGSTTGLSELSIDSPEESKIQKPARRSKGTPFARSRTTFDSPMDVQMGEPSPMSIASLSLSPRRNQTTAGSGKNIFAAAEEKKAKWEPTLAYSDDEDDIPELPSPTRTKAPRGDPFKAPSRPGMLRQKTTATMQKLTTPADLFGGAVPSKPLFKGQPKPTISTAASQPDLARAGLDATRVSPNRRLSKIPSSSSLAADASGSPKRSAPPKPKATKADVGGEQMFKAVMQRNMGGRTLVELQQARAGGRPLSFNEDGPSSPPKREGGIKLAARMADGEVAVWNPDTDEMPSPFLARGTKMIRNLR